MFHKDTWPANEEKGGKVLHPTKSKYKNTTAVKAWTSGSKERRSESPARRKKHLWDLSRWQRVEGGAGGFLNVGRPSKTSFLKYKIQNKVKKQRKKTTFKSKRKRKTETNGNRKERIKWWRRKIFLCCLSICLVVGGNVLHPAQCVNYWGNKSVVISGPLVLRCNFKEKKTLCLKLGRSWWSKPSFFFFFFSMTHTAIKWTGS